MKIPTEGPFRYAGTQMTSYITPRSINYRLGVSDDHTVDVVTPQRLVV